MDKRKIVKTIRTSRGFGYMMECLNCKKEFRIKRWDYDNLGKGSYCSNKCKGEMQKIIFKGENNPNYKGGLIEIVCVICGKKKRIKRKDTKNGRGKYCSKQCKDIDNSRLLKEHYINHPETKKKVKHIGSNNGNYGRSAAHGKGDWYVKKNGEKIWMRSSYELKFAKWLDDRNLIWEYEPQRFYLKDRTYAPDFKVKNWKMLIEVKGWFHKRHQETIRQFRKYNPRENLLVLTKPLLKAMKVL